MENEETQWMRCEHVNKLIVELSIELYPYLLESSSSSAIFALSTRLVFVFDGDDSFHLLVIVF